MLQRTSRSIFELKKNDKEYVEVDITLTNNSQRTKEIGICNTTVRGVSYPKLKEPEQIERTITGIPFSRMSSSHPWVTRDSRFFQWVYGNGGADQGFIAVMGIVNPRRLLPGESNSYKLLVVVPSGIYEALRMDTITSLSDENAGLSWSTAGLEFYGWIVYEPKSKASERLFDVWPSRFEKQYGLITKFQETEIVL